MRQTIRNIIFISLILGFSSCRFGYSFNGGSVPIEANNFSVKYFTNKAPQADPKYSRELSEALIDLLNSQTRLDFSQVDGDIRFEGSITDYNNRPVAVASNETSSQERLTIAVKLKYINTIDPAKNVETNLSRFRDYDPTDNFDTLEDDLVTEIIGDLVQDIYDKSLGDW